MRAAMGVLIMTTAVITEPPTAQFTVVPNPADINVDITFDASASTDPNGRPLTHHWNFGDGTTGDGIHVLKTRLTTISGKTAAEKAFNVDEQPPLTTLATDPAAADGQAGWFVTNPTITLTAAYPTPGAAINEIHYRWGSGAETVAAGDTAVFAADGSHTVSARLATATGKTAQATASFLIDAIPPLTSLTTVPSTPNGVDGWFVVHAPQVKLNATDTGSTPKEIHYWWNSNAPTVVAGASASFYAPVGENTLHYYAVNQHDLAESEKQAVIKFDAAAPDLNVLSIADPGERASGTTFDISWTVKNIGGWAASGTWLDRIYLSTDDQPGSDTELGSGQYSGNLLIGGTYTRTVSIRLPDGLQGQHWLIVKTDLNNSLFEGDETNNVTVGVPFNIRMSAYPDLQVVSISAPATGNSGEEIEVTWQVANSGDGPAIGTWTDRVYLSADQTIGADQVVGSYSYSAAIQPGAQPLTRSTRVRLPSVNASGNVWLVVKTDELGELFEHNNDNNAAIDDQPVNIPASLTLTFASSPIPENAPSPNVLGTVKRNTGTTGDLVVTLANTLPARITVPASLTIQSGRNSAASGRRATAPTAAASPSSPARPPRSKPSSSARLSPATGPSSPPRSKTTTASSSRRYSRRTCPSRWLPSIRPSSCRS